MSLTRLTLLTRLRNGDDCASWDEFHTAYHPLLSRYVVSQGVSQDDAPDVIQEIFAKLVRVLKRFDYDPRRARFRTWLFKVARSHVADWRRRQRRRREAVCSPEVLAGVRESAADFDWDREHRQRVLEFALECVRDKSQRLTWVCFAERYLQGRTAAEVALETGLSENGVYTNAKRIFDRVRNKCLQFDEDLDNDNEPELP